MNVKNLYISFSKVYMLALRIKLDGKKNVGRKFNLDELSFSKTTVYIVETELYS